MYKDKLVKTNNSNELLNRFDSQFGKSARIYVPICISIAIILLVFIKYKIRNKKVTNSKIENERIEEFIAKPLNLNFKTRQYSYQSFLQKYQKEINSITSFFEELTNLQLNLKNINIESDSVENNEIFIKKIIEDLKHTFKVQQLGTTGVKLKIANKEDAISTIINKKDDVLKTIEFLLQKEKEEFGEFSDESIINNPIKMFQEYTKEHSFQGYSLLDCQEILNKLTKEKIKEDFEKKIKFLDTLEKEILPEVLDLEQKKVSSINFIELLKQKKNIDTKDIKKEIEEIQSFLVLLSDNTYRLFSLESSIGTKLLKCFNKTEETSKINYFYKYELFFYFEKAFKKIVEVIKDHLLNDFKTLGDISGIKEELQEYTEKHSEEYKKEHPAYAKSEENSLVYSLINSKREEIYKELNNNNSIETKKILLFLYVLYFIIFKDFKTINITQEPQLTIKKKIARTNLKRDEMPKGDVLSNPKKINI